MYKFFKKCIVWGQVDISNITPGQITNNEHPIILNSSPLEEGWSWCPFYLSHPTIFHTLRLHLTTDWPRLYPWWQLATQLPAWAFLYQFMEEQSCYQLPLHFRTKPLLKSFASWVARTEQNRSVNNLNVFIILLQSWTWQWLFLKMHPTINFTINWWNWLSSVLCGRLVPSAAHLWTMGLQVWFHHYWCFYLNSNHWTLLFNNLPLPHSVWIWLWS